MDVSIVVKFYDGTEPGAVKVGCSRVVKVAVQGMFKAVQGCSSWLFKCCSSWLFKGCSKLFKGCSILQITA